MNTVGVNDVVHAEGVLRITEIGWLTVRFIVREHGVRDVRDAMSH
jgi:hypothetical protein